MTAVCYGLSGKVHDEAYPCNPSVNGADTHSTCCSLTDICLASGLCMSSKNEEPDALLWVTGCTDKTFNHQNCAQNCLAYRGKDKLYMSLTPCGNDRWCCGSSCCSSNFTLAKGVGTVVRQMPSLTSLLSVSSETAACSNTTIPEPGGTCESTGPSTTGLIAGLVVAVVAFLLALAAFAVALRRLRSEKRSHQPLVDQAYASPKPSPQMAYSTYTGPTQVEEYGVPHQQSSIQELGETTHHGELDGNPRSY